MKVHTEQSALRKDSLQSKNCSFILKLIPLTLAVLTLASCGYSKALTLAEPKGFIERKEDNLVSDQTPFQYVWKNPDSITRKTIIELGTYKLYVAPVTTELLEFEGKDERLAERASVIAEYLHTRLKKEIGEHQGEYVRAELVENRKDADVTLEIALTEIGLGSPLLYTGAWLLPLPGTGTAVDSMQQPLLSIEARFIGEKTGEAITEMADRRIPPIRILDLNKVFSKMAPLREVSNRWALEIGKGLQTRLDKEKLAKTNDFSLLLW